MIKIDEILEIIKANEEIAKKLFDIELKILTVDNFKGLFEELLKLIEEKFEIPHVWISIIDNSQLSRYLGALDSSSFLKNRVNTVPREVLLELFGDSGEPILANENLRPYFKLMPETQKYLIKSLALAPVMLGGNFIGSLNMGDFSQSRFQPDMDTFFLSQLVLKVSICLSNVTAHEELRRLATRDPLTDLPNRREMELVLDREFNRLTRYGQPLVLLFIDCDGFKEVNDEYGHECGDMVLRYVACHMKKNIRPSDLIFRFAGDEFVIILPHQTLRDAATVSDRLQRFFREHPVHCGEQFIPVSISIGMSSTEELAVDDPASLLKTADQRLYESKKRMDRSGSRLLHKCR